MLEINLLPPEAKKGKILFGLPKIKMVVLFIWIGAFLLASEVVIGGFALFQKHRIERLVVVWQELMPLKKKADFLRDDVRMLESKAVSFDRLIGRRFEWAKKLNSLSDSITQGVWLTSFSLEKKEKKWLLLAGRAVSLKGDETELLARFIKSLKGNQAFFDSFDDIELASSKMELMGQTEVMGFILKCRFKDNVEL